ncbi:MULTISPECIES: FAD-dependent monooxygenase [Catenuloplanes]|uniref:FAD-dependent urate hydroxylase n=1 Tax=Catenuloplanes niger TaxID=587534 RepID=A0AAE3ZNU9_9ACTN|nr:FAD-dependent monooxygenase [Catenuloplanes niger]MDR7322322.1 FAD-dependent urate hydroxylase [Catenuloplanes niger]
MAGTTLRILIVGAGIAGLGVARALRMAGLRPDVVDREPPSAGPGAAIFLPGNATRALAGLGLTGPLRPLGAVIHRQSICDAGGEPLCELDLGQLWDGVGESRALPRADLQRVLVSAVGGVVRHNTAVTNLELDEGGPVKVDFADGTRTEYDLVIGADGRRSTVRALAGLGGAARRTGQFVYRSVVYGGPPVTDWTGLLGAHSSFVVMPMGDRRLYCYAHETVPDGATLPDDGLARVREVFGGYGGPVPAVLDALEKVQLAAPEEVEVGGWSRGRVLLVGDAAHSTSPTLSQGAAMALEDAIVLAEVLRTHAGDLPAALAAYEKRRRPRTRWVLDRTRDRDRTGDVAPDTRDPLLRKRGDRIFRDYYAPLRDPA